MSDAPPNTATRLTNGHDRAEERLGEVPMPPTPRRYLMVIRAGLWDTLRNVKDARDYVALCVGLLAVAGITVSGVAISWRTSLPTGAAALALVALGRGGYRAWRDQVHLVIAGEQRIRQCEAAREREEAARSDPQVHLRIDRLRRGDPIPTELSIRCTNDDAQEVTGLQARIIEQAVWMRNGWREARVADADLFGFDGSQRTVRIGAGSKLDITIATWTTYKASATLWRFRAGPVPEGAMTATGRREPTELHYQLSDLTLDQGRFSLTVAFEAPGRRTQEERLCFSFSPRGSKYVEKGLTWLDPATGRPAAT